MMEAATDGEAKTESDPPAPHWPGERTDWAKELGEGETTELKCVVWT